MWRLTTVLLAAVNAHAASVLHERRGSSGPRLSPTRSLDPNAILPMRIGLTQQNLDRGYDYLMDVSSPGSTNYGKHWNSGDVNDVFAPAKESVDAVLAWLKTAGITTASQTSNKGWISFNASAAQAGSIFETTFHEYEDQKGSLRIGCDEYSLPEHLVPHVDYVVPGVKLSPPVKRSVEAERTDLHAQVPRELRKPAADWWVPAHEPPQSPYGWAPPASEVPAGLSHCGANITAACYRYLYNIPEPNDLDVPAGVIGVFEYQDTYLQSDLNLFFEKYAPEIPQGTHPYLYSINGAVAPSEASNTGESDIDFTIVYSLLGPANVSLYQTQLPDNDFGPNSPSFIDAFLDAIDGSYCEPGNASEGLQCGSYPLTEVVSFSYEAPELFEWSAAAQVRTCNEFMKLGLQGHTFVFSSGDYGVASNPAFGFGLPCVVNGCVPQDLNMDTLFSFNGTIFSPNFPSNCPYVLSVGATQLNSNQTVQDPESVLQQTDLGLACTSIDVTFSSSGGFANYFDRPSYQDAAIERYFDAYVPDYPYYESNKIDATETNKTNIGKNGGVYNRNGRAIPDVSANGAHYLYYLNGNLTQSYGTSLATPLWAALIAILNSDRKAAGKSPVGFINPILYENPWIFNDITNGSNPGCFTDGFPAVEGWDPATGLGTPNFAKMRDLFASWP